MKQGTYTFNLYYDNKERWNMPEALVVKAPSTKAAWKKLFAKHIDKAYDINQLGKVVLVGFQPNS